MVVFKQSQIAHNTNISPSTKNARAESIGENVRDREHQHEREFRGRPGHLGGDVAYVA